ncbi:MCE family protein [Nocardia sp. NPDC127526]|uniref:MCE family protein n=1 Tax=Nocardia sp. NPDC127526 TaxID=3345393 RepID=UPI0036298DFB
MTSTSGALWRLGLFASVVALLLFAVAQAIVRPVSGETDTYAAIFTDVSGLKTGDDVRMFGVAVGKVDTIDLDGNQARVRFTVQRDRPLYDAATLAIRFQTLTGQRYIDVRQPDRPGNTLPAGSIVDVTHTQGSFDVTALVNGLEPVLAEFSPAALNQFTQSVLAVIDGDGAGIGPALDAVEKLSGYVTDRQLVIATLFRNLKAISDEIGGRSPHLITLLRGISDVFAALQERVDGLIDYALNAPPVLGPLNSLITTLGLTEETNPSLEDALRRLFPDPRAAVDQLAALPGLIQSLTALIPDPAAGASTPGVCSQGKAELPQPVAILIAGQRIAVCKS